MWLFWKHESQAFFNNDGMTFLVSKGIALKCGYWFILDILMNLLNRCLRTFGIYTTVQSGSKLLLCRRSLTSLNWLVTFQRRFFAAEFGSSFVKNMVSLTHTSQIVYNSYRQLLISTKFQFFCNNTTQKFITLSAIKQVPHNIQTWENKLFYSFGEINFTSRLYKFALGHIRV